VFIQSENRTGRWLFIVEVATVGIIGKIGRITDFQIVNESGFYKFNVLLKVATKRKFKKIVCRLKK
jgi:hypothetical protein